MFFSIFFIKNPDTIVLFHDYQRSRFSAFFLAGAKGKFVSLTTRTDFVSQCSRNRTRTRTTFYDSGSIPFAQNVFFNTFAFFSWQGLKESNPYPRFWRPIFYRWTKPLETVFYLSFVPVLPPIVGDKIAYLYKKSSRKYYNSITFFTQAFFHLSKTGI